MKYQTKAFYPETPWHLIRVLWCILTLMVDMCVLTNTYPEGETDHSWTLVSEKNLRCWSHPWESAGNSRFQRALQHQSTDARQRAGTGVSGRGWYTVSFMPFKRSIKWWLSCGKAGLQDVLFSIHLQKQRPNDDTWRYFQGLAVIHGQGCNKTKVRAHPDYLIGSINEATSLEIGSVMFGSQDLGEVWIYIRPLMLRIGWK